MTDHPLTPERIDAFRDRHIDHHSCAQEIFDAGREHERANPVDDRPWEPLNEGDPVRVGDEARQEMFGVTHSGIVARLDESGDPRTAQGGFIGMLDIGTWHVRRPQHITPGARKVEEK